MRKHLTAAWFSLAVSFVGTVLIIAVAGGMILLSRCGDRVLDPLPDDFICSNGGVSGGFIVGTSVVSATVLVVGIIAAGVLGGVALSSHGSSGRPQPAAFLVTMATAVAVAVCTGWTAADHAADATTVAGAVLQGITRAAVAGSLTVFVVGPCLGLVAHLLVRRMNRSRS
ncbi:hypothetical protein PU630_03285 [Microbacterium horticulturae]|uniref:Uncharacterized protein n=1 Tax=Microbacterium horticulturae TaxID=3028316 RepID=A0ABY8BZG9_9MICO|nr:hypothetical protein [Microbacterium sp. KACC 23027]WEG09606.1 hypothetical protein PU630_03285 [Microbacterium sp. KACC 23027]